MAQDAGPASYLHFAPDPAAGLIRRAAVPLVLQNWSFVTWLRLETPHGTTPSTFGAALLSLFSSDPDCATAQPGAGPSGVVLLVRDARIFAVSIDRNAHRVALGTSCQLVTRRWHHVAVTIETTGALLQQPSTVTLFLDGQRIDSGLLRIAPASPVGFLSLAVQCGMPCADWPTPLEPLRAQLGSVYLFSQALSVDKVCSVVTGRVAASGGAWACP